MPRRRGATVTQRTRGQKIEMALLRLAAIALDVQATLSPSEIEKVPALKRALAALNEVFHDRYRDAAET